MYGSLDQINRSIFSQHNRRSLECHNTSIVDLFLSSQKTDAPKLDGNLCIKSYKTILQCGLLQKATNPTYVDRTIILLWPSLNSFWGLIIVAIWSGPLQWLRENWHSGWFEGQDEKWPYWKMNKLEHKV